jgi:twinkle protein
MDFAQFIAALGFEPPSDIVPGRIIRFSTNGRSADDAGWALLFADCDGGIVGDWRSGEQQIWQAEKVKDYTPEQKVNWQRAIETARKEAEEKRRVEHDEAAKRAAEIWATCQPAPADHPYLVKKKIKPHGARIYRGDLSVGGMACDGALVIPARRSDGVMRSLQFIDASGEKRYLPRGEIAGSYFAIGKLGGTLCMAEGFATAATVSEATNHCVAVAFDAGNLEPVAAALRSKYPKLRMIVCADNDYGVKAGKVENPGLHYARLAAEKISARLAVPELPTPGKCDFNDLALACGVDVAKLAVDPTPAGPVLQVSTDDTAFLRHMVEQEGRSLCRPSAYLDEVQERVSGRYRRHGVLLPWKKTHGLVVFEPKQVTLWPGINGHGKSVVLNQVLMEFGLQGHLSWLASLEMPVAATLERMVRQAAGVRIPSEEYVDAFTRWMDGKLFLHDHIGRESPKKMAAMIRYVHEQTGCQHFVVDSMMRVIRGPDDYAGQKEFIELLCAAAHDLAVHIHVVAHMRKGESELDKPDKFDVKGAGEVTDLVDNVFIVWRNKKKERALASDNSEERAKHFLEPDTMLICTKQRHGDWEGEVGLWYEPASKAYHESTESREWQISPKFLGIEDHVPF